MNIMKLVKLVYLLDRLSMARRGIPVVGGAYFSLPNVPITSELLDLINSGCLSDEPDCRWDDLISDRQDHLVALKAEAPSEHLSPAEMDLIDEIYRDHGTKDQWELRDWCHEHCEEWTPLEKGRDRIPLENIARAVGKTDEQIKRLAEEAAELNFVSSAFARK
ncbi:MAG: SocA family protein [Verrucomicrobiales bacterium]|nr:SocA family protein [Verrucomicrobiales bacterium]